MSTPRKRRSTSASKKKIASQSGPEQSNQNKKNTTDKKSVNSPPRIRVASSHTSSGGTANRAQKVNKKTKNAAGNDLLWTMGPKKKKSATGEAGGVKSATRSIGSGLSQILHLITRSKIATIASVLIVLAVVVGLGDLALNWGKVYQGVKVGDLDLSGVSIEEAESRIASTYQGRLDDKEVYIFANDNVSENMQEALDSLNNQQLAEQQSVQDAAASQTLWITNASALEADIDAGVMASAAVEVGRSDGGIIARIAAFFGGVTVDPWVNYNDLKIEELTEKIDASIGDPRVNYGIEIVEGFAIVITGHDGYMVNRKDFVETLNHSFLSQEGSRGSFVAWTEYAPLQIHEEQAKKACEDINNVLSKSFTFTFEDAVWSPERREVGSWINAKIEAISDDEFDLVPFFDTTRAKGILMNHLKNFDGEVLNVTFTKSGDTIEVHAKTDEDIPLVSEAIEELNSKLFSDQAVEGSAVENSGSEVVIHLRATHVPATISFEEALDIGIITPISAFTTEYSANAEARNHNIHLASSKLTDSIVAANGGTWSFNDTAGECNEAAGFMAAGAIYDDEIVQEYGGGICQVATTVYNSVYNSGFPIVKRYSHTLYMASYPAGRDAAVSWPDLDLVWKNDSTSDVLVKMSYTDTSVTSTLYGVNPEYQVSTIVGEWQEGKKYTTETEVDETLAPGKSYIKTKGIDGSSITIVRVVKDKNGNTIREESISSTYSPQTEVKVEGPEKKEPETEQ